jgi:xanthine dehydrogenase accessory factor
MDRAYRPDRTPYEALLEPGRRGKPAVLATVVEASGSTPQVPGASALFDAGGLVCGTVGGGSVEARTAEAARTALRTGRSRLLDFDLSDHYSDEADAVCGGRLTVLLDADPGRHRPAFLLLRAALVRRRSGVLAAFFDRRTGRIERRWSSPSGVRGKVGQGPWPPSGEAIRSVLASNSPTLLSVSGGRLYLEPHFPPPRLIIAGAGHVGRAVARQGKLLGFEVTVVDDRPDLAARDRIPEADAFVVAEVAEALAGMALGSDAFVVLVTRGHRHDAEALRACLPKRPAYLGMIGSGRKIALMREDFLARGWARAADWDRVHAPIGLPIGSRTVEEIAVSIAAELIKVRREAAGSPGLARTERSRP